MLPAWVQEPCCRDLDVRLLRFDRGRGTAGHRRGTAFVGPVRDPCVADHGPQGLGAGALRGWLLVEHAGRGRSDGPRRSGPGSRAGRAFPRRRGNERVTTECHAVGAAHHADRSPRAPAGPAGSGQLIDSSRSRCPAGCRTLWHPRSRIPPNRTFRSIGGRGVLPTRLGGRLGQTCVASTNSRSNQQWLDPSNP